MVEDGGLRVVEHASELGEWRTVYRKPSPALRPFVHPYCGYEERAVAFERRRQAPGIIVPVIINLGPPLGVSDSAGVGQRFDGPFVAGLHQSYSIVESAGEQRGVQVNFSPLGARMFFGLPMAELTNGVHDLEDTLGDGGREFVERMQSASDWHERFDLVEEAIETRFREAAAPSEAVAWAWTQLVAVGGNLDIGTLADGLGWSNRRLIAEFRDQLGMAPKLLGRVVRFNRARMMLERSNGTCIARVAEDCGYYDQAHFNRDFREFSGLTPREYLRSRMPDGDGVSAATRA